MGDEDGSASFLGKEIAPHLPEALLGEALLAALAMTEGKARANALRHLIPLLPKSLQEQALSEALNAARAITKGRERADVLRGLIPYLPETSQEQVWSDVLRATMTITEDENCAMAIPKDKKTGSYRRR